MQENSGYLTINRISGEPERLLEGYRRSSETMAGVGRDHGLIVHAAAATDTGLLIVNLWPSRDESEAAAADPRRLETVRSHDLGPERMHAEHHDLESLILFGATVTA